MYKSAVLILGLAAFSILTPDAFAITTLTQSQVQNVCGPDLKDRPGGFGCSKKCADGKSTCIYDCSNKTGNCSGHAVITAKRPPKSKTDVNTSGVLKPSLMEGGSGPRATGPAATGAPPPPAAAPAGRLY